MFGIGILRSKHDSLTLKIQRIKSESKLASIVYIFQKNSDSINWVREKNERK